MGKITERYTNDDLKKYDIYLEYLVNPATFNPVIIIHTIRKKYATKEFEKGYTNKEINKYIDSIILKIIIERRLKKINKILKHHENVYN